MKILICNERFLFRFGVDRVLLLLAKYWKQEHHEIVLMGNKKDDLVTNKIADNFIEIPEATDYLNSNEFTEKYLEDNWDSWFDEVCVPDIVLVAGWPFYRSIEFLKKKCKCVIFYDFGAVPTDGMIGGDKIIQEKLRELRAENLKKASGVIAISKFLEETQSKIDTDGTLRTGHVHLGVDHLDLNLWNNNVTSIRQKEIIEKVIQLKNEGYKILLQPGRWENGNYKNSLDSIKIAKFLKEKGIKFKILTLGTSEILKDIPYGINEHFLPLGFIDDETMKEVILCSDIGFLPTLWEGFNLPLGEMQYLGKPMFVFNVGAHPEVIMDSYFLCENIQEMCQKVLGFLQDSSGFSAECLNKIFSKYKYKFVWKKQSELMLQKMCEFMGNDTIVFIDVTNACHDTANSGVMRVTRKISNYLQKKMDTIFIVWDDSIKRYVLPFYDECEKLCSYGGPNIKLIKNMSISNRILLDDIMDTIHSRKIHLFTETVRYDVLDKGINYFHSKGIPVATIFYDAIPVIKPELVSEVVAENHKNYMMSLSKCDVVFPIAEHNGQDLKQFWERHSIEKTLIKSLNLAAEVDGVERICDIVEKHIREKIEILFVSTLEPRKNHINLLKAFRNLMVKDPSLCNKVNLTMVGNRYAGNDEIPKFVEDFCNENSNAKWLGPVSDEVLKDLYRTCDFTVYPSVIEGFGMPIIESMWYGKPCLCSNSGSIGELGSEGGCCLTDVSCINSIEKNMLKMITDKVYLKKLQNEATKRNIITWDKYTNELFKCLNDTINFKRVFEDRKISIPDKIKIQELFEGSQKKVVVCSNFYPPNFVGGAEIIAHNQAKSMQNTGKVKVLAVTLSINDINGTNTCYIKEYDGITMLKICVDENVFNSDGINFYNKYVDEVFDELCSFVNPDVVHCHNIIAMSLGIISIAKKYGAKVFETLHDHWGFCFKNTLLDNKGNICKNYFNCFQCKEALKFQGIFIPIELRRRYFRRIFEKIDGLISPSQYLADNYIRAGFGYHKMHVLWNGVDNKKFSKVNKKHSSKLRITYIGYFGKHKGVDVLIKALAYVKNKDISLNLVGCGEEEKNYKYLAQKLGILENIRFWGKVPNTDILSVFEETDVYCLPSVWPENQPVSITEAMACGIPVIASDAGGNKELVEDGVNGYLFKVGDYKMLAEKIRTLHYNHNLISVLGENGRKRMLNNDFSVQCNKLLNIYDNVVSETISTKKLILFKGYIFPNKILQYVNCDFMHIDWVNDINDVKKAVACILLPNEGLNKYEFELLKNNNIPLYIGVNDLDEYVNKYNNIKPYKDEKDLIVWLLKETLL